jgi:transposase
MSRMTLITGQERRRRWSDEERAWILAEIAEPGAVVAEVARRADVCTSLVYRWRREARKTTNASGFAPVLIESAEPAASAPGKDTLASEPCVIVVEVKEARVRICADAPSALIAATLKALRS